VQLVLHLGAEADPGPGLEQLLHPQPRAHPAAGGAHVEPAEPREAGHQPAGQQDRWQLQQLGADRAERLVADPVHRLVGQQWPQVPRMVAQ
jgi:hypothetical protein